MGANAQTSVLDFTNGQVLTGPEMDISAGTGVPVFATTVTRDAAFGGANKVLAEGQTCYLESTNVVQYYDGAAWATVGPTAAPTSGLVVVKAETAFTTSGSVTADGVFTSAYSNYMIMVTATGTAEAASTLQLRVGGVAAATNYNRQKFEVSGTTVTAARTDGRTSYEYGAVRNSVPTSCILELFGPQLAAQTNFMARLADGFLATIPSSMDVRGNHSTAAAYDGITLTFGSNSTGTYTIYGYGKTL